MLCAIRVDTDIGDDGLAAIGSMPHLTGLRLPSRIRVTDAGLANISGLRLTELDLQDFVNITDDGLLALRPMAPYLYVWKRSRSLHVCTCTPAESVCWTPACMLLAFPGSVCL